VNRILPGTTRDVALLIARLVLGTIMFAHGYQKLMIDGLGRTTQGFESMSIPVAIFSAAFVTVVEIVGGVLVILGALLTVVAAFYLIVMVGAAVFVHIQNGIFVSDNGWELVGAIAALLLALAAAGSGRFGLDHVIRQWQARSTVAPAPATPEPVPAPAAPVARHDFAARAAAFTEVLPRVTADDATPPVAVERTATDPPPAPLPVRRRRSRPSPVPPASPELRTQELRTPEPRSPES
jgi:putative oxidoreductase